MAVISVPKPPKSAFNPKRRASQLLKDQVRHLEWAVRPASERQPHQMKKIKAPRTEAEAAARIQELTRQLHAEGAKPAAATAGVEPKPAKRRRTPKKRGATRSASRKTGATRSRRRSKKR